MVQSGGDLDLALEPLRSDIGREVRVQNLEGDVRAPLTVTLNRTLVQMVCERRVDVRPSGTELESALLRSHSVSRANGSRVCRWLLQSSDAGC